MTEAERQELRDEILREIKVGKEDSNKYLPTEQRELVVTNVSDLQSLARGTVVELPPFAEGQAFIARLKRPSMLVLVKSGKIPNELLTQANELFAKGGGGMNTADDKMMTNIFKIMDSICEASFMEPTYEEIKASGVELTDEQLMFVFNYSQRGVKALGDFRKE